MPFATTLVMLATLSSVGLEAVGPPADARAPRHQLSLELLPVAGALGYGFRVAPNTSVGFKLGLGVDMLTSVPVGGGHFASDWGVAYQTRDGSTNKRYFGIVQAALFMRHFLPQGFHLEGGLRLALGVHFDSSDDDAGGAQFAGAYGAIFWGGSIVSVGTQISIGALSEYHKREFAVVFTPVILKLTTP